MRLNSHRSRKVADMHVMLDHPLYMSAQPLPRLFIPLYSLIGQAQKEQAVKPNYLTSRAALVSRVDSAQSTLVPVPSFESWDTQSWAPARPVNSLTRTSSSSSLSTADTISADGSPSLGPTVVGGPPERMWSCQYTQP